MNKKSKGKKGRPGKQYLLMGIFYQEKVVESHELLSLTKFPIYT